MKPFEVNVSSKYGAPMGRPSDKVSGVVRLERVPMVDGDYDAGGAYWGGLKENPLWCAWNDEGAAFLRAKSLDEAKAKLVGCTVGDDARLEECMRSYLECALWSSNDNADESGGDPLDDNYSPEDFTLEALERARKDVAAFLSQAGDLIKDDDAGQVGHDFWLTRNHHGAGFWDRGHEESKGEALTDLAQSFGEVYLYVTSDGKVGAE